MFDDDGIKRRAVLKKSALLGTLSMTGYIGTVSASAEEASIDVDSVLQTSKVRSIQRTLPQLELKTENATVIGDSFAVSVPANYGSLIVVDPKNDPTVLFDFDERVPEFDVDWPQGTRARLKATRDDAVFQRTTTDAEARVFLNSIDRSELYQDEDAHVSVTPGTGTIDITYMNQDARRIEVIRAQASDFYDRSVRTIIAKDQSERTNVVESIQIVDKTIYNAGQDRASDSVSTKACRNCNNIAPDVLLCLSQVQSCSLCAIGSPAPPVMIACIIIVCLGGSGGLLLELLADAGCTNLASCAYDCFEEEWKDLV